jgi:hypothetical protein
MGESDFPAEEAALFYSPRPPDELEEYTWVSQTSHAEEAALFYSQRPPEELEEYTWVSQTSLQKRLLSSTAQDRQRSWRNTHG